MENLMDSERIRIAIISFLLGVILAFIVYPKPEQETIYKTKVERLTDTLYLTSMDTVYVSKTKIKTEVLRDTILIDFKPQISRFETLFPFEHGSTKVSGEVLGEVLKMTATNDYNIPVVTNTIIETKTETIIKKSKGLYLGANVNSALNLGASASYVDDKYLFSYQFQPVTRIHMLGVSKKLF
jgi:hypothetical protein